MDAKKKVKECGLYSDSVRGRRITLALNAPTDALPEKAGRRCALNDFLSSKKVTHIIVNDSAVWGTDEATTLVEPQMLEWDIVSPAVLYWPLDEAVYIANVVVDNEIVGVERGSEEIVSAEAAIERISNNPSYLIVQGGNIEDQLRDSGFAINDGYPLTPDIRTVNAAWVYATSGMIHAAHIKIAGAVATLAVFAWILAGVIWPNESSIVPTQVSDYVQPPPKPKPIVPSLGSQLEAFADTLSHAEILHLFGLSTATYDGKYEVVFKGQWESLRRARIRSVGASLGARMTDNGNAWTMAISTFPKEKVQEDPTSPIVQATDRFTVIALKIPFTVSRSAQTNQDGKGTEKIVLSQEGHNTAIPAMRQLSWLLSFEDGVSARMDSAKIDFDGSKPMFGKLRIDVQVSGTIEGQ